jgi:hypothetical protein
MSLLDKIKAKVDYEKESYRLSQEHMAKVRKESPELFRKKGKR